MTQQPFDRFTEGAERVLIHAQKEAERSQHGCIGTEHLLLALLEEGSEMAAQTLRGLGVEEAAVRQVLETMVTRPEGVGSQTPRPTSQVKKAIELAWEEAHRLDVDPEHLLLGVVTAEGIAARLLRALGVSEEAVRSEARRQRELGSI